jgi:hypothetical protein
MQTAKKVVTSNDNLKNVNDGKVTSNVSSHPIGTTLGTIGGAAVGASSAAITGAAVGLAVGPAGAAVGAAVGAVAGAMTGHIMAGQINPKEEDLYWRANYSNRPYINSGSNYTVYQPAYMYGVDSFAKHDGRSFDEIENDLGENWDSARGTSTLEWDDARHATRDAYDRLTKSNSVL